MSRSTPVDTPAEPVDVFLVEDNPGDIRLTKEAFEAATISWSFRVFTTGDDAVDSLLEDDRSVPSLVLLDLNLPGNDGCQTLETIRETPQLQHLPVIILTSSDASGDVRRCYDAHVNAYLTKPDDHEAFVSMAEAIGTFWFTQVQLPPIAQ